MIPNRTSYQKRLLPRAGVSSGLDPHGWAERRMTLALLDAFLLNLLCRSPYHFFFSLRICELQYRPILSLVANYYLLPNSIVSVSYRHPPLSLCQLKPSFSLFQAVHIQSCFLHSALSAAIADFLKAPRLNNLFPSYPIFLIHLSSPFPESVEYFDKLSLHTLPIDFTALFYPIVLFRLQTS